MTMHEIIVAIVEDKLPIVQYYPQLQGHPYAKSLAYTLNDVLCHNGRRWLVISHVIDYEGGDLIGDRWVVPCIFKFHPAVYDALLKYGPEFASALAATFKARKRLVP